MQKTRFKYEVIIHDDCSTDGTTDIIREYAQKHPELIVPIFQSVNQYQNGNKRILATFVYPKARGKYIALCEGDDYWTDPLKLQKQVDFLESHPDYGMCYTKTYKLYNNKIVGIWGDEDCSFYGLLNFRIIPTLSRVEKRSVYDKYIAEIKPHEHNWLMGDFPVLLFFSLESKIHLVNEVTGVYRVLDTSASHSKDMNKLIGFYDSADDVRHFFINKYIRNEKERDSLLMQVRKNEILYKISICIQYNDYEQARKLYQEGCLYLDTDKRKKYGIVVRYRAIFGLYREFEKIKKILKIIKFDTEICQIYVRVEQS